MQLIVLSVTSLEAINGKIAWHNESSLHVVGPDLPVPEQATGQLLTSYINASQTCSPVCRKNDKRICRSCTMSASWFSSRRRGMLNAEGSNGSMENRCRTGLLLQVSDASI